MRRIPLLLALSVAVACADWTDQVAGPNQLGSTSQLSVTEQDLRDRYIVVLRSDVQDPSGVADQAVAQFGGQVHFRYQHAIKGFAATLPAAALAGLQRNPQVSFIAPDGIATISGSGTDNSATWGLDRIDQRDLPRDGSYTWTQDGTGVHVYIVDTGIWTAHNEFGGRASVGFDAMGDGRNGQDCNGHGTHVAGTVAGTEYGVAKKANVVAVRVLGCSGSGTWAGVIAGVDWVTANADKPAVANMSLGGGVFSPLDAAITTAVGSGITFAVAAGNSNANACNSSPARAPAALTVGATTSSDARASYSNFGSCVDLFAPGSGITSAWWNTTTGTRTISGTSMASPHVAGVAALHLSANPNATPAAVETAIEGTATPSKVTNPGTGSPNLLLYSLLTSGGSPPPPPPGAFPLTATGSKVKGIRQANLAWSGATTANVDVYRNNTKVATTPNDGAYTDNAGKGGGSITYKVCEAATQTCSNNAVVNF
jgi:subtilisin family serine protease